MLIVPTLKIRLFPFCDRDQFAVEIFLPEGKGLADTRRVAQSVYDAIRADERITGITTFIGCSSPRFQTCYAPQMAGRNYAQFIVNTTSQQATLDLLADYQPRLSEAYPEAYVKFRRLDYLEVPELEFRFYGEDIDSLHVAAERLMQQMRPMPELEWVHTDFQQPFPLVSVELDPVAAAQLGVNRTTASLSLATATADLHVGSSETGRKMYAYIVEHLDYDQLLFERSADGKARWLHVSYRQQGTNRHSHNADYVARIHQKMPWIGRK
jgi:multidrug efflux pump subunit AcrB